MDMATLLPPTSDELPTMTRSVRKRLDLDHPRRGRFQKRPLGKSKGSMPIERDQYRAIPILSGLHHHYVRI
jgi:hypothetical protein